MTSQQILQQAATTDPYDYMKKYVKVEGAGAHHPQISQGDPTDFDLEVAKAPFLITVGYNPMYPGHMPINNQPGNLYFNILDHREVSLVDNNGQNYVPPRY